MIRRDKKEKIEKEKIDRRDNKEAIDKKDKKHIYISLCFYKYVF